MLALWLGVTGFAAESFAPSLLPPNERPVTLRADNMPLQTALGLVARAANVTLNLDEVALRMEGLSPASPITVRLEAEPLNSAVGAILHSGRLCPRFAAGADQDARTPACDVSRFWPQRAPRPQRITRKKPHPWKE